MAASSIAASAKQPIVIAHRGASGYLPEHTLAAKALAHAMGADYLEQDLVLSKDGVPVVLHDIHVDAVTDVAERFPDRKRADGRYYAIDFTLAELKQLRVTERFNPKTGRVVYPNRFPLGKSSFQIATFEEDLQLIQGLNRSTGKRAGIYPEIKSPAWHRREGQDISKVVLEIVNRYGYRTKQDAIYLQCFEFEEVKRLRTELGYRGRLVQLLGDDAEGKSFCTPAGLAEVAKFADGIGPALSLVVKLEAVGKYRVTDLIVAAHAAHLEVHPYTFRADDLPKYAASLEELLRVFLVEAQADGVFTDFPDRAVAFLKSPVYAVQPDAARPQPRAHAHNDYKHPRPLRDALAQGFCSVEADIWLVDGQLLVAHDREEAKPERTLQSLYLDPLRERIRANGGRVYRRGPVCTLMIDVKSEATPTYAALREVLRGYAEILTEFTPARNTPRALTVILSGNSPREMVAAEPIRLVALDGRLADLDGAVSPQLIPLISDDWKKHFTWRGAGPLPEAERQKLRQLVQRAHEQGRQIRFWGGPDDITTWRELESAGVDLIGTDDLSGLAKFLSTRE